MDFDGQAEYYTSRYANESIDEQEGRPGRPRAFDADAALDAALAVFWRNGYEGASLTDLTAAMGINRPSLYAAFGNKQSLFRRVMDRYAERGRALVEACEAEPTARAFVENGPSPGVVMNRK